MAPNDVHAPIPRTRLEFPDVAVGAEEDRDYWYKRATRAHDGVDVRAGGGNQRHLVVGVGVGPRLGAPQHSHADVEKMNLCEEMRKTRQQQRVMFGIILAIAFAAAVGGYLYIRWDNNRTEAQERVDSFTDSIISEGRSPIDEEDSSDEEEVDRVRDSIIEQVSGYDDDEALCEHMAGQAADIRSGGGAVPDLPALVVDQCAQYGYDLTN